MAQLTPQELDQIRNSMAAAEDSVVIAMIKAVLSGGIDKVHPELLRICTEEIEARGISAEMMSESRRRKNTMRITESKLRRIIRRKILEFGEKDADLIKKLQNRERMIGIGMDGGTMPFNPNWDYDSKPAPSRTPRGYMGDIIKQVPHVIEKNGMHEWLEAVPTRNPEVIHLVSGDLVVKVENDYGTLTFDIIKPRNYNWSMECETIDNEIDNVLYELGVYVSEIENS